MCGVSFAPARAGQTSRVTTAHVMTADISMSLVIHVHEGKRMQTWLRGIRLRTVSVEFEGPLVRFLQQEHEERHEYRPRQIVLARKSAGL